ncbi:ESPR-type extended signal peptide-containing protein, partial [Moraxella marmotae]|uniref:ESPR-type extended signal peptide-containing protein n=1 Tax=Moraxella marmotae TaxID=3344520 RepID=UPI0035F3F6B3
MNKIYRIVFNKATQTFQAVCEYARAQGKSSSAQIGSADIVEVDAKTAGMPDASKVLMISAAVVAGATILGSSQAMAAIAIDSFVFRPYSPASGGGPVHGNEHIALGARNNQVANDGISIGNHGTYAGGSAVAVGVNANGAGGDGVAIGHNSNAGAGHASIAIGGNAQTKGSVSSVAIGQNSEVNDSGYSSVAVGTGARAVNCGTVAIGGNAVAHNQSSVALGYGANATLEQSTALGHTAKASNNYTTAVGQNSTASGYASTSLGRASNSTGAYSLAIGSQSLAEGEHSIAIGSSVANQTEPGSASKATGKYAISVGLSSVASAESALAFGKQASAAQANATAIGTNAQANNYSATAIGRDAKADGLASLAFGYKAATAANATDSIAIGNQTQIGDTAKETVALGSHISTVTTPGSVILGSHSAEVTGKETALVKQPDGSYKEVIDNKVRDVNSAKVGEIEYTGFAGTVKNTGRYVSFGAAGDERQLKNVAPGAVSATSTDAINGSQLFSVAKTLSEQKWKLTTDGNRGATVGNTAVANDKKEEKAIAADGLVTLKAGDNLKIAQNGSIITLSGYGVTAADNSVTVTKDEATNTFKIKANVPPAGKPTVVKNGDDSVTVTPDAANNTYTITAKNDKTVVQAGKNVNVTNNTVGNTTTYTV